MKLFLLDHRSEIFQTFSDSNQLYSFCNRSVRNMKGKTLIAQNGMKAAAYELGEESPSEINTLAIKMMNQVK